MATDSRPLTLTPRSWTVLPFASMRWLPDTRIARTAWLATGVIVTVAVATDPSAAPPAGADKVTEKTSLADMAGTFMIGIENDFDAESPFAQLSVP
jgi:hypothetical protein